MTRTLVGAARTFASLGAGLALLPAVAAAQAPAVTKGGSTAGSATAVRSVAMPYETVKSYVLRAAEQMPESDYAYKPTETVRSFGQLVGHVADAQQMICAGALGEAAPTTSVERTATTKAALVAGLRASIATCDRAYAQADAAALQPMSLFGQQTTRLGALALNGAHSFEHYGNMVTYLRMKGLVPPSSQGGGD